MAKKAPNDNIIGLTGHRPVEGQMNRVAEADARQAVDEAQELICQAWESDDPIERIELAELALKKSEDCVGASVLLAEESADSLLQALTHYQKGVEAGERALGKRTFEQDKGHFWGLLETRPTCGLASGWPNACGEKVNGMPPLAIARRCWH